MRLGRFAATLTWRSWLVGAGNKPGIAEQAFGQEVSH